MISVCDDDMLYLPQVLQMAPGLTQLEVVPFKVTAYNKKLGQMDFYDSELKEDLEFISVSV